MLTGEHTYVGYGFGAIQAGLFMYEAFESGNFGRLVVAEVVPEVVERIREAPCRADLTREELIRIVTWIDANTPYYGTHRGKKNHRWKDEPDFRPLPLAGLVDRAGRDALR